MYEAVVAPVTTIVPTAVLPPEIPSTSHAIAAVPIPQKVAVNVCACPSAICTVGGAIELGVAHAIVTAALPVFAGSATLAAVTVTVAGDGITAGAV